MLEGSIYNKNFEVIKFDCVITEKSIFMTSECFALSPFDQSSETLSTVDRHAYKEHPTRARAHLRLNFRNMKIDKKPLFTY